jgi:DNA-binding response OmpR family regulator
LNILVVDDNQDFAESIAELLEDSGHQVSVEFDGEGATEAYRTELFDLCLMDLKLPGIDGIEAMRSIRTSRPEAQVLIMTGHARPTDVDRAFDEGALTVMTKPFSIDIRDYVQRIGTRAVVLLVEDDLDFADSVIDNMRAVGYVVEHCKDVAEARIRLSRAPAPQLLLLDLKLGEESGMEVFTHAREQYPILHIVVVTAYAGPETENIERMRSQMLQGVVEKPFDMHKLVSRMDTLILSEGV